MEGRPPSKFRLNRDLTTMAFDRFFDNRQTNTGAFGHMSQSKRLKYLENSIMKLRIDTRTVV